MDKAKLLDLTCRSIVFATDANWLKGRATALMVNIVVDELEADGQSVLETIQGLRLAVAKSKRNIRFVEIAMKALDI